MRAGKGIASWIASGLLAAGCWGGGTTTGETGPGSRDGGAGDAGHPGEKPPGEKAPDHPGEKAPDHPGEAPPPPSGKVTRCEITNDTALGTEVATSPSVAFAGGRFAAAWTESGGVYVAVADEHGNPGPARALPAGPHPAEAMLAAAPAGGFVAVWREPAAVRGVLLAADGTPTGGAFTVASTAGGDPRPSVLAVHGETEIAWADAAGVTTGTLSGTTLAGKATVPGASDPSLAACGDAVGLVFATGSKLGFARLAHPAAGVSPVLFRDAPGKANVPRASPAGDGFFVTWEDDRGGDGHETVFLTRVGADGKPAAEVPVPGDAGSANYPDIATLGDSAAVVYYQFRDGPSGVYLSLFGPDLRRTGDDLEIAKKGARTPRIAAGGGGLGVAYTRKEGPARLTVLRCQA